MVIASRSAEGAGIRSKTVPGCPTPGRSCLLPGARGVFRRFCFAGFPGAGESRHQRGCALFELRDLIIGIIVFLALADAQRCGDPAVIDQRDDDGTFYPGVAGGRFCDTRVIRLQVTHGDGFTPFCADTGHAFAEGNPRGDLGDMRREACLRDQFEEGLSFGSPVESAGAAIEQPGNLFDGCLQAVLDAVFRAKDCVKALCDVGGLIHKGAVSYRLQERERNSLYLPAGSLKSGNLETFCCVPVNRSLKIHIGSQLGAALMEPSPVGPESFTEQIRGAFRFVS